MGRGNSQVHGYTRSFSLWHKAQHLDAHASNLTTPFHGNEQPNASLQLLPEAEAERSKAEAVGSQLQGVVGRGFGHWYPCWHAALLSLNQGALSAMERPRLSGPATVCRSIAVMHTSCSPDFTWPCPCLTAPPNTL